MSQRLVGGRTVAERQRRQPDPSVVRSRAGVAGRCDRGRESRPSRIGAGGGRNRCRTTAVSAPEVVSQMSRRQQAGRMPSAGRRRSSGAGRAVPRPATSASRSGLVARSCPRASVESTTPRNTGGAAGALGQACKIEAHAAPRLAGSQSGSIDPPRLGAGRTVVQSGRDHGQHRHRGPPPERLRPARCKATRSRGTARSARAYVPRRPGSGARTANRSGSASPNPGMPRAVSGLNDSRTNRSNVASSSPVSGVPSKSRTWLPTESSNPPALPVSPEPSLLCARAWVTRRFMASRTSGWSGWYAGPSGLPWRSTRTSPRRAASGESARGKPGQRARAVEVQLQPERKPLPRQDPADDFQAIGAGRVFVGLAIECPAQSIGRPVASGKTTADAPQ